MNDISHDSALAFVSPVSGPSTARHNEERHDVA
jgi:hypothetical protein